MTGKEKIRATIQEIDQALQELITGNTITLYSGGLPGTLEEQKQILDILANENQVIRYSQSDVYKSEDDIDPYLKIHIMEENAGDGIGERMMTEEVMRTQCYEIEVLDAFAGFAAEAKGEPLHPEDKPFDNNGHILVTLDPENYDKKKGVIHFDFRVNVAISRRGSAKKADGTKYFECWILECVFKSVNTMRDGATFSKVLGLASARIGDTEIRKIRNAVDAINNKVTDNDGPQKLLKIQKGKIFVNNSYL